jgi:dephospho-CoA kinase
VQDRHPWSGHYRAAVLLIGLTGGIGSGKSTVSAGLAQQGATVIDADAIVHELQEPGTEVFAAIVERFGHSILDPGGALDRQALADRVFADPEELAALNAIVHPAVGAEIAERLGAARPDDIVIMDVPLLVESGRDDMAGTIVVDLPVDEAVRRLVGYRGFTEADARARIGRQVSRTERLARADLVIDNSGDLVALEDEIDRAWAWIAGLGDPQADAVTPPR